MHWLMAVLGAFFGAAFGAGSASLVGLVLGALVGWQGVRIAQLRARLVALEQASARRATGAAPLAASQPAAQATAHGAPESGSAAAMPQPTTRPGAATTAAAATTRPETPASPETPEAPSAAAPPPPLPQRTPLVTPITGDAAGSRAVFEARELSSTPPARPVQAQAAPAVRTQPAAPQPRRPEGDGALVAMLKRLLFEGNVPVKLGMLVLFFGVAAALKYAVDQGFVSFPLELRLGAIAAAALGLLFWGWRNREVRPAFGLSLQGGAIGVLLLTVFATYGLYRLLPASIAFALVVLLVAGAALLAVLQDAVWLALLGLVGGYLAPVLISTGSGNHVALFSYYAVLNTAVFAIAWARSWRALNLIGFAFTFVIGTLWGAKYYRPEHFASVEPFLVLFFLFYVAIPVLHCLRDRYSSQGFVDGTLVFGTPLLAFPLQVALLADNRMALAWSAMAMALLYALLAAWLLRRRGAQLLGQCFAALALGFATLAVPLALSARWTSASWAVEGAALVWLGLRQQRRLPVLAGWLLQLLAALAYLGSQFFTNGWSAGEGELPLLNGHALLLLLMSLSLFFIAWLHERAGAGRPLVWPGFIGGSFWWGLLGIREISEHFRGWDEPACFVLFAALTAALAALLRGVLRWPRLGWLAVGGAVSGPLLVLGTLVEYGGVLDLRMHLAWLVWFAALAFALWRLREPRQRGLSIAHVVLLASAAWLYGATLLELAQRNGFGSGWQFVAALLPLLALVSATWRRPAFGAWPLADLFPQYRARWFAPAAAVVSVSWIAALAESGGSAPLPFVPLLNPVELFQLALLLVALSLARRHGGAADPWRPWIAIAAFGFLTFAGLRAVHHYHGAPWSVAILDDRIAQTTLTVLWSVLGVGAWIYGSRRRLWNVWLVGAILMGVVLAKLVLVDRQYVGNLAGIISFMAVGALLVLVGRIAPTPPRARGDDTATEPGR